MPSSVVAAIKYDASSSTLRVTYVSGMIYDYKNIPEEVYTAMKASFSKGVFLNQHIKGKYAYEKIKVYRLFSPRLSTIIFNPFHSFTKAMLQTFHYDKQH